MRRGHILATMLVPSLLACGGNEPGTVSLYRGVAAGPTFEAATITVVTTGDVVEVALTELSGTVHTATGTVEGDRVFAEGPRTPGIFRLSLEGRYLPDRGWMEGSYNSSGRFIAIPYEEGERPVTYCVFVNREGGANQFNQFNLVVRANGRADGFGLNSPQFTGERVGDVITLRFAEAWESKVAGDSYGSLTVTGISVSGRFDTGTTVGRLAGGE
ncbi:MAG TPA: hypothetical protein VF037_08490, partial [Gemmatimonadales bacterium]